MAENLTPHDALPPVKRFKTSKSDVTGQDANHAEPKQKLSFGCDIGKMTVFGSSLDVQKHKVPAQATESPSERAQGSIFGAGLLSPNL